MFRSQYAVVFNVLFKNTKQHICFMFRSLHQAESYQINTSVLGIWNTGTTIQGIGYTDGGGAKTARRVQ